MCRYFLCRMVEKNLKESNFDRNFYQRAHQLLDLSNQDVITNEAKFTFAIPYLISFRSIFCLKKKIFKQFTFTY